MRNHLVLLHLHKTQFERCLSPEDLHHDLELLLFGVHFLNERIEAAERSVNHLHVLANLVRNDCFFGYLGQLVHRTQQSADLIGTQGSRNRTALGFTQEAEHIGDVSQLCLDFSIQLTLYQYIAGQVVAFLHHTLAVSHCHYFLGRNQHLFHVLGKIAGRSSPSLHPIG